MDRVFSLLLWPKREARGPWKKGRKKRGSITCRTDWANEANKMFIIWLCWLFRVLKGDRELEVSTTATYGPGIDQSQHAKSISHIIIKDIKSYSSNYNNKYDNNNSTNRNNNNINNGYNINSNNNSNSNNKYIYWTFSGGSKTCTKLRAKGK